LPTWLLEDTYSVVGDLAETISLLTQEKKQISTKSLTSWISELRQLENEGLEEKRDFVFNAWSTLNRQERFVFNKLITGGFRLGVSQKLTIRALSKVTKIDQFELSLRLMGNWHPDTISWNSLIINDERKSDISRPYPFCLAYGLDKDTEDLGQRSDWVAEWKWDGIRGQIIKRAKELFIWSRGEENLTERFPELEALKIFIPDGSVLDGEIVAWGGEQPLNFNILQKRIGRKKVSKSLIETSPVILIAYDLLEFQGKDIRNQKLGLRRSKLEKLINLIPNDLPIKLSEEIENKTWSDLSLIRETSRSHSAEGIMLKNRNSDYSSGRKKGVWWKWKLDPLTIDGVLIYAQAGHGRRANLYTDYTFAIWDGNQLVPFTKAYSGLKDEEFRQITSWVKKNTIQKFGPVRQVQPELVFEIAFEGIHQSTRHKSGVALRFPRMLRWRHDKLAKDADKLKDLKAFLT
jgi:DNA ligase-1